MVPEGINGALREKNGGERHWVGDALQCPSSPFSSLQPSLTGEGLGGWGWGDGSGAGCGSAPALAAPKKVGWARGRRWALWTPGKGGCRRGVPFRTRRALRGRSPTTTKALSGLGWTASPTTPSLPDTPIFGAPLGVRGQELLLAYPHSSGRSVGNLVCHLACPTGLKGRSRGRRGRGTEGYWAFGFPDSVPQSWGGSSCGVGMRPPIPAEKEGGEGKGRRGWQPGGTGPRGVFPTVGSVGKGGHDLARMCSGKFCALPRRGTSRAERGARREPRSGGEVGRGAGRWGEDYSIRCSGDGRATGDERATGLVPARPFVWRGKASPPPLAGCWEGRSHSRRVCPVLGPQAAVAAVCLSPETAANPFPGPGLLRELEGGCLQGHPLCWCSQKKRESFPCSFFSVVSVGVASPLQHTDKWGV